MGFGFGFGFGLGIGGKPPAGEAPRSGPGGPGGAGSPRLVPTFVAVHTITPPSAPEKRRSVAAPPRDRLNNAVFVFPPTPNFDPGRTTKDGRAAVQPLPSLPERWKPPCDGTPRPAAASTHAEAAWLCRPGVALQQLLRSDSEKAAAEAHAVKEAAGAYRKGRWSATALRALPAPARLGRTIIESRLGLSTIRLLAGAHAPHESRATDHARRKPL